MGKISVAVDIDGTLRNLQGQLIKYLEVDHPDKVDKFRELVDQEYYSLDPLFKTKKDLHQWMYNERVFELFGMAQKLHPKVIDELNIFTKTAEQQGYEIWISSVQKDRSITATLHWLSKWGCRVPNIKFFSSFTEKIEYGFDVYVDDCPDVIISTMESVNTLVPSSIKVPYGFNKKIDAPSLDIQNGEFNNLYNMLGVEKILYKE